MEKKEGNEDRSNRRIPISTAVRIRCENWDRFQTEYSGNISESGVFITTEKPLSPGTLFTLEMAVGREVIQSKAQVIWTKEFASEGGRPSGMGARFVEMDAQSQGILSNWITDLN